MLADMKTDVGGAKYAVLIRTDAGGIDCVPWVTLDDAAEFYFWLVNDVGRSCTLVMLRDGCPFIAKV